MCTVDCVEKLLVNLKVVAKVPAGGRVVTYYDRIELDTETLYQPLLRWWRGQSRLRALEELKRTYQHALQFTATPAGVLTGRPPSAHLLTALRHELAESLQGLHNLKNTYADDVTTQSKLQLLIDEVTTQLGLPGVLSSGSETPASSGEVAPATPGMLPEASAFPSVALPAFGDLRRGAK